MSTVEIRLTDPGLFGNDAAEDEPEEIFRSYAVERPEASAFSDPDRHIAVARAYKGEGKSALLRLTRLRLAESLDSESVLIAKQASEIVPDLPGDDYAQWIRAWKAAVLDPVANEIGSRTGFAWSDDAMTLVELAEKNGFKAKGVVASLTARLRASIQVGGVTASLSSGDATNRSIAGAVTRRAKQVPSIWVIIDDLDKNFENTRLQRTKIASFFDAMRELTRAIPELRIRAAIRPNVWTAIKMEFESLSHVEQYVHDLRWMEEDARRLLARRIEGYLERNDQLRDISKTLPTNDADRDKALISLVFESPMPWGGTVRPPHVLLYTLSKHRPRWIVELSKGGATRASEAGHVRIRHEDLLADLATFGDRRIQDTIAEFKSQCPHVDELISAFNRQPEQFTTAELLSVIDNKILQHLDPRISGVPGKPKPVQVAAFLFEIGFIFGRRDHPDGSYEHVTFTEKPSLFLSRASVDDGLSWEIHPVFRQSLEMRDQTGKEVRRGVRISRGNTRRR